MLLRYSYERGFCYIASALSHLDYVYYLFSSGIIKESDNICIGKPFGAQAYYVVWSELNIIDDISKLSLGLKSDEISFVDFSEETIGNALGVAAGISLCDKKRTWVNISDAALQMGNTLEAIQFIGSKKLNNILLTIDYNKMQVTGKIQDIMPVDSVVSFFMASGWNVIFIDGHSRSSMETISQKLSNDLPNVIFFKTQKGYGVDLIESDPVMWHYKFIDNGLMLESLVKGVYEKDNS